VFEDLLSDPSYQEDRLTFLINEKAKKKPAKYIVKAFMTRSDI
jgi:hypothetical protein